MWVIKPGAQFHMTTRDTNEIYAAAIEAVGAKRVANALGYSLQHTYRLARPTMDLDPDGTGARSDLDRIEALVNLLAAYPDGRPVLMRMRSAYDEMFDRALGAWQPVPLTRDSLAERAGKTVKEFAEFLATCSADGFDGQRLQREGAEAIEAIERLMRSASVGMAG